MLWEVFGAHLGTGLDVRVVFKAADEQAMWAVLKLRRIVAESINCLERGSVVVPAEAGSVRHEPVAPHASRLRESWMRDCTSPY